jgi:hypothetical protein
MYFIETQKERIVKLILEGRLIEYSIQIIDLTDSFIIYIQGYIKVDESRKEFYINERYLNSQFESVLNSYNLKKLFDIFNELGRDENNDGGDDDDPNGPDDIDDFLSGKIK